MKAALLIIMCAQQGYWQGGQEATVTVQWAEGVRSVDAVWRWELQYENIALAEGRVALKAGKPAELKVDVPKVSVRTPMTLSWELVAAGDGKRIEQGKIDVHVFADDPLQATARRLGERQVAVFSADKALTDAMQAAAIKVHQIEKPGDLVAVSADVIVVGANTLPQNPLYQQPLIDHARAGATVIVLRHSGRDALLGFPLIDRRLSRRIECRPGHPLRQGLTQDDIVSLVDDQSVVLRVSDDAGTTAVVFETPKDGKATAVDAMVATQQVGRGRLVFCQLPLDGWAGDPRSRRLLADMLEFTLAPVANPGTKDRAESVRSADQPITAEGVTP